MSTFDVTFLGHQGWVFAAGESRLMVDPLLTSAFGHMGALGVVHPPRIFSFEALPPVDALLITHEHEDHFDVPTLARIDRDVPVLLSSHASRAASSLLTEMGFGVYRVRPGDVVRIGDLELHMFAPDVSDAEMIDEWDVLPFLVRDRRGHGSFFTTVDVEPHEALEKAVLAAASGQRPAWCYTNNATDWSFSTGGKRLRTEPVDSAGLARALLEHYAGMCLRRAEPEAIFMCGGGFAFAGDRAWMNERVFRADSAAVCASFAAVMRGTFRALAPGETAAFEGGKLREVRPESAWVRCEPPSAWPSRDYAGAPLLLEGYSAATSARELEAGELEQLGVELDLLAAHLCSRRTFRALMSLDPAELDGRRPTFSLVALCDQDGGAYVYEYDPASCAFVGAPGVDPVRDYVGGLECWASDLLAVFRGELAPSAITFGRSRSWNALPNRCEIDWGELWLYCHPLRRPDRFSRFYRMMLAGQEGAPRCVQASRGVRPIAIEPWRAGVSSAV